MPDHDVIFSQLATGLNNQVTPFVALLRSKDCTGSVHFSYSPYCLNGSLFLALEMLLGCSGNFLEYKKCHGSLFSELSMLIRQGWLA